LLPVTPPGSGSGCRAGRGGSALEAFDELDIAPLRLVALGALEGLPGIPLGAADEVGHARAIATGVAFGRLLVQGVELEQGRVVGTLVEALGIRDRVFEPLAEIFHRSSSWVAQVS